MPSPSEFLGQARSWDMPFKILGTGRLLGQALQNSWDDPALGTLGASVGSNSTVIEYTTKRERVIPPAEKANTKEDVQQMYVQFGCKLH